MTGLCTSLDHEFSDVSRAPDEQNLALVRHFFQMKFSVCLCVRGLVTECDETNFVILGHIYSVKQVVIHLFQYIYLRELATV